MQAASQRYSPDPLDHVDKPAAMAARPACNDTSDHARRSLLQSQVASAYDQRRPSVLAASRRPCGADPPLTIHGLAFQWPDETCLAAARRVLIEWLPLRHKERCVRRFALGQSRGW
jgi:hypothetical protein